MKNHHCPCEPKGCCKEPKHYDSCCVVYDKPICCKEEKEFHHKITHIVPVKIKQVETNYNHHFYEIEKCCEVETYEVDCGLQDIDCGDIDGCCK